MVIARATFGRSPRYAGLRMTADEYLALEDDGFRYELIDGVVVMSPSPTPEHQDIRGEIEYQLRHHARQTHAGVVLSEVDVRLDTRLVYRPDLVFIRSDRVHKPLKRIDVAPDLVVEVLSPGTEVLDQKTKRDDYERFGVAEYWLVDNEHRSVKFLRLLRGRFIEVNASHGRFVSEAVPGFELDLASMTKAWHEYDEPK